MRRLILFAVVLSTATAQTIGWREHAIGSGEDLRGAALSGTKLYTWGAGLSMRVLPAGKTRVLASGQFGEGGCAALGGVVLQEGEGLGRLVFLDGRGRREVIDEATETHDCLEATLFARQGVLAIHRYAQVRFHERARGRWSYTEIYSIYTPSQQGGLALADVDGDGRTDILCGNYWIRAPERFDLPWHVFAINTYFENPLSAMLRLEVGQALPPAHGQAKAPVPLAWTGGGLAVSQGELAPGRLTWFERPADPTELWTAHPLADDLARPHALAAADFDGDGRTDLFVAENNAGQSRWFMWWGEGGRRFRREPLSAGRAAVQRAGNLDQPATAHRQWQVTGEHIGNGRPLFAAWASDVNRDGRPDLVLAGPRGVLWLENGNLRGAGDRFLSPASVDRRRQATENDGQPRFSAGRRRRR